VHDASQKSDESRILEALAGLRAMVGTPRPEGLLEATLARLIETEGEAARPILLAVLGEPALIEMVLEDSWGMFPDLFERFFARHPDQRDPVRTWMAAHQEEERAGMVRYTWIQIWDQVEHC
jgi:hypothetical protein